MIGLLPILARWRLGLSLVGAVAALGLIMALSHYRSAYHAEKARFENLVSSLEAKRIEATKNQQAVNNIPANVSKIIAEKSNAKADAYYSDVRRAADRMHKDSPHCPSPSSLPGADQASKIDDRSSLDAGMVSITSEEYNHYNQNTARLAKVRQDALELIESGVAVPASSSDLDGER